MNVCIESIQHLRLIYTARNICYCKLSYYLCYTSLSIEAYKFNSSSVAEMPDAEPQTQAISQTQDDEEYENEVEDEVDEEEDDDNGEAATCSALCTLGTSDLNAEASAVCSAMKKECSQWEEFTSSNCCPKQLQLPMFLSSTYQLKPRILYDLKPQVPL